MPVTPEGLQYQKDWLVMMQGVAAQAGQSPESSAKVLDIIERQKAAWATPMGQNVDLNKWGAQTNSFSDPAFKDWKMGADGVWIEPAPKPPPPIVPAASDAWTSVAVGTIITEGGQSFEVRDTPFGKFKFLIRATAASPTTATEKAAYVEFIKVRLTQTADLEAQAELVTLLEWLSKRA